MLKLLGTHSRYYVCNNLIHLIRSNYSQMFYKIGVIKSFANFSVQHLCQSHFLIKIIKKVTLLLIKMIFLKKWLQHRCFPMKFAKFIRICFSQNTFRKIASVVFKKSHTWEEGGAHLRSSFWHLLMNFEKPEKSKFWKNEKKKKLHMCTKSHNYEAPEIQS